jgi:hypothetical protein
MLNPALRALAALFISFLASLAPAWAGERIALADAEAWGVALYANEDEDGGLPGGGVALNLGFDGLPATTLALDYSDSDARPGEAEGLGVLLAVDLMGGGTQQDGFLRLSYRAGESSLAFGDGGSGGVQQTVTLRAGLRW